MAQPQLAHPRGYAAESDGASFGIEKLQPTDVKRAGKTIKVPKWIEVRELTPREVELLKETETTRPVRPRAVPKNIASCVDDSGRDSAIHRWLAERFFQRRRAR